MNIFCDPGRRPKSGSAPRPMYGIERHWWEFYWFRRIGRWWGLGVRSKWHWYDTTFRFNGGGWLGSAEPYVDYQIGVVYVRRYLKKLKVGGGGGTGPT